MKQNLSKFSLVVCAVSVLGILAPVASAYATVVVPFKYCRTCKGKPLKDAKKENGKWTCTYGDEKQDGKPTTVSSSAPKAGQGESQDDKNKTVAEAEAKTYAEEKGKVTDKAAPGCTKWSGYSCTITLGPCPTPKPAPAPKGIFIDEGESDGSVFNLL